MKSAIAIFMCSWALGLPERQSFSCSLSRPLMSFEKKLATPVAPLVLLLLMVLVLLGKGWKGLFWGMLKYLYLVVLSSISIIFAF